MDKITKEQYMIDVLSKKVSQLELLVLELEFSCLSYKEKIKNIKHESEVSKNEETA